MPGLSFLHLRSRRRRYSTGSIAGGESAYQLASAPATIKTIPVFAIDTPEDEADIGGADDLVSKKSTSGQYLVAPAQGKASSGDISLVSRSSYGSLSGLENGNIRVGPDGKLREVKCRSITIDTSLLFITAFFLVFQFALYDYYFVAYGSEHRNKFFEDEESQLNCTLIEELKEQEMAYQYMWYFFVPDLVALIAMLFLPFGALYRRYYHELKCSDAVANLRFASVSWFIYACVLDAKIIVSSKSFLKVLQFFEICDLEDVVLGVNAFVIILCATSVVFFILVLAHHAHTREARELLHSISESMTFDVLDGVHFLAILFSPDGIEFLFLHHVIENAIIGLVCVNFLLPTMSLIKVFHKLSNSEKHIRRMTRTLLIEELIYQILHLMLINLPYFVIRCYLWNDMKLELSVFLLKNAIMMLIEMRQIFIYSRRIWKHKKGKL